MTMTASPGGAASSLNETIFGARTTGDVSFATTDLICAMLDSGSGISDLIFSPGRPPQVERHGDLTPVAFPDLPVLRPVPGIEILAVEENDGVGRRPTTLAWSHHGWFRPDDTAEIALGQHGDADGRQRQQDRNGQEDSRTVQWSHDLFLP